MFGIQRDDSKLFHRFGLEIEEMLEDIGTGDPALFKIIPIPFSPDLFEDGENPFQHIFSSWKVKTLSPPYMENPMSNYPVDDTGEFTHDNTAAKPNV